jgi:RNA recognition motif-containing protein
MVDRATNRSRGFGFITYEHEESVEHVLRAKNELLGKWVEVKRAEPRDARYGASLVVMMTSTELGLTSIR